MAASAWEFFNGFKRELGLGNVPLDGTGVVFQMRLYQSSAQLSATGASAVGSLTNEVVNNANYGARTLTVDWTASAVNSAFEFTFNTVIWTTGASALSSISYAVIYMQTASTLICWSRLSTAQFDVAAGNNLVIEPNGNAFTLS